MPKLCSSKKGSNFFLTQSVFNQSVGQRSGSVMRKNSTKIFATDFFPEGCLFRRGCKEIAIFDQYVALSRNDTRYAHSYITKENMYIFAILFARDRGPRPTRWYRLPKNLLFGHRLCASQTYRRKSDLNSRMSKL